MPFDFDKVIDRKGTASVKHDLVQKNGYPEDVLPMWVADMDFEAPKCVLEALEERLRHGIFGYSFPEDGYMEAVSVKQTEIFEAAERFARVEGILPAPESSHAIKVAIDEALKCKETGETKTIVFGLTGTGYFDMVAYEKFHDGKMDNYIPTDEEIAESLSKLPVVG